MTQEYRHNFNANAEWESLKSLLWRRGFWHIHCPDIPTKASLNSHKSLLKESWNNTVIPINLWLHFLNIQQF